jgi:hypothetical protein
MLRSNLAISALFALIASPAISLADDIPYPKIGTPAPVVSLTAASTGQVTAYYLGDSGASDLYVRMIDVTTGTNGVWTLENNLTPIGTALNMGTVNAGDKLAFQTINLAGEGFNNPSACEAFPGFCDPAYDFDPNSSYIPKFALTSDPALSFDGQNYAYVTSFSGDSSLGVPAGVYIGMEGSIGGLDYDYNDDTFSVTNVNAASPVPEPGSIVLLGTGLLGAFGAIRRKYLA